MWNGLVHLVERLHLLAVEDYESTFVAHRITIVGGGEDGDALAIVSDLVSHVFHLVRPNDVVQLVSLKEVLGDVGTCKLNRFKVPLSSADMKKLTELTSNTSLARRASLLRLRVRPEKLTHDSFFWRLSVPLHCSQVIDRDLVRREQPAVHHQHSVVQQMAQRQEVVHLREHVRHGGACGRKKLRSKWENKRSRDTQLYLAVTSPVNPYI